MLRKMYQSMVYGRMMSAYSNIPASILTQAGLDDPRERHARAYESAYGHRPDGF